MKESIDQFLDHLDDVLSRAFPGLPDDEAVEERATVEVSEAKPWPVSAERQRQLERMGDPDNESW